MQKPLPHSPEAERAVLGALLLEPGRVGRLAGRLRPEDFYLEAHQKLYRAFLDISGGGGTPDLRTLQAHLELAGELGDIGGLSYLAVLDLDLPDIGRTDEYVGLVIDRAARRHLVHVAGEAIRGAVSASPMPEVLASLSEEILSLETRLSAGSGGQILGDILQGDEPQANPSRAGWGWVQADRLTVGFAEQTLTVLAGQSGMGKSSAAASIIRWNAKRGLRIVLRSVEEGKRAWGRRLLAQEAGVSLHRLIESKGRIRSGGLHPEELERVAKAEAEMASWRVTIIDSSPDARGVESPDTPEGITATFLAEHDREVVDFALIDHLQDSRTEEGWEGLVRAMKVFRVIPRRGIPTAVLSQVSPKVEQRAQRFNPKSERADWLAALRPLRSDLGGASALDQIPDVISYIFRPDYFAKDGEVHDGKGELIIRKNRYGVDNKIIPLRFNPESTAFEGS